MILRGPGVSRSPSPRILYLHKFRLKKYNYTYLAHQTQNFLRQGGTSPFNNCIHVNLDEKGTEIVLFLVSPNTQAYGPI